MSQKHLHDYLQWQSIFTFTASYNAYVHIIDGMIGAGACGQAHRENQIAPIDDETALLHFLSGMSLLSQRCIMSQFCIFH